MESAQKKRSLRTSEDVLSRLKWDDKYDINDYILGYEDRIVGPMEMDCGSFVPIAQGGDLPYHRIWYIRGRADARNDERNDELDGVDERNDEQDGVDERNDEQDGVEERNDELDGVDERNDELDGVDERNDELDGVDERNDELDGVEERDDQDANEGNEYAPIADRESRNCRILWDRANRRDSLFGSGEVCRGIDETATRIKIRLAVVNTLMVLEREEHERAVKLQAFGNF